MPQIRSCGLASTSTLGRVAARRAPARSRPNQVTECQKALAEWRPSAEGGHHECCDIRRGAQPELSIFELRDGRYGTVAVTTASLTVERPFPVTITPAQLTRRLRPRGTEAS